MYSWYNNTSHSHIRCANCGHLGHVYKMCNFPICSFGIICFRKRSENAPTEYLMVQRRDSLCYVEFVRGKYVLQNKTYILTLLSNMTSYERSMIFNGPFSLIWKNFWQTSNTTLFVKEYDRAFELYSQLCNGYYLRSIDSHGNLNIEFFNLEIALQSSMTMYSEPEWGFPKGRRNINESDFDCAKREFFEETCMSLTSITILSHIPVEEVFYGLNKVNYRHVYFIAQMISSKMTTGNHIYNIKIARFKSSSTKFKIVFILKRHVIRHNLSIRCKVSNTIPISRDNEREIRRVQWFNYENVISRIRPENVERVNMFKQLHMKIKSTLVQ